MPYNKLHQISLFISMAESSSQSMPTGEHLAFLGQEHRVELAQHHLKGEGVKHVSVLASICQHILIPRRKEKQILKCLLIKGWVFCDLSRGASLSMTLSQALL